MRSLTKMLAATAVLAPLALVATPAYAQEEEASGPIDVEFTIAALSDYRFRGVSLNNEKLAIQPEIAISHESGAYLTFWGSNVADNGGDDIEIDVTLGFAKEFGDITADVGVVGYFYPGASGLNYGEILGSLSAPLGKGSVGVNIAYAPDQNNIGGQDNIYWGAFGEMPIGETPITLNASIGVEDGAFGDNKVDWSFGADIDIEGFTAGVKYIDTARSFGLAGADGTVVFSLSKSF
jgi:uncharacterized protein (TIGR02001 family)